MLDRKSERHFDEEAIPQQLSKTSQAIAKGQFLTFTEDQRLVRRLDYAVGGAQPQFCSGRSDVISRWKQARLQEQIALLVISTCTLTRSLAADVP